MSIDKKKYGDDRFNLNMYSVQIKSSRKVLQDLGSLTEIIAGNESFVEECKTVMNFLEKLSRNRYYVEVQRIIRTFLILAKRGSPMFYGMDKNVFKIIHRFMTLQCWEMTVTPTPTPKTSD